MQPEQGPNPGADDKTGAEEIFYKKHMQRRTPMVLVTVDGEELRGWIEWYDRDVVKLHSLTRHNCLIPKNRIKYIHKHINRPGEEMVPTPPPLTRKARSRHSRTG